jgi:hypothetical protein
MIERRLRPTDKLRNKTASNLRENAKSNSFTRGRDVPDIREDLSLQISRAIPRTSTFNFQSPLIEG